jgi:hypothetical protein
MSGVFYVLIYREDSVLLSTGNYCNSIQIVVWGPRPRCVIHI